MLKVSATDLSSWVGCKDRLRTCSINCSMVEGSGLPNEPRLGFFTSIQRTPACKATKNSLGDSMLTKSWGASEKGECGRGEMV